MNNDQAIERYEHLAAKVMWKGIGNNGLEGDEVEEYQNLNTILEAGLRSCKLCKQSNCQVDMMTLDGIWGHVDCGYEHHQSQMVDPTTRGINESDDDYAKRMESWDKGS